MKPEYKPNLNSMSLEKSEPKFLVDERFLEFLESKEVDLNKYKDDCIKIWEFPASLYVQFHNSFPSSHDKERVIRNLNADRTQEESDTNKLIEILVKLLDTLDTNTVSQLLKVFREIKKNV